MDTTVRGGCAARSVIAVSMRPGSPGDGRRPPAGRWYNVRVSKHHPRIGERLAAFMLAQPVFFVGTAPAGGEGHVNVSPKGLAGSFAVLGPHEVAYLDLTGSGAETIAHLRDDGRICLMFCAFEGPPNIVRLHGRGEALLPGSPGFDALAERFADHPGRRAIVRVDVDRVSDSCGFAVPRMTMQGDREQLVKWARKKGDAGLAEYRRAKNARSIDGLPALDGTGAGPA